MCTPRSTPLDAKRASKNTQPTDECIPSPEVHTSPASTRRPDMCNLEAQLEAHAKKHVSWCREVGIKECTPSRRADPISRSVHVSSKHALPRHAQSRSAIRDTRQGACFQVPRSAHPPNISSLEVSRSLTSVHHPATRNPKSQLEVRAKKHAC